MQYMATLVLQYSFILKSLIFQFCCVLNSLFVLKHFQDDAIIVVNKPPGMAVQVGTSDFLLFF